MKAIYLIGEPGVGKSTVIRELYPNMRATTAIRLNKQLWGQPLKRGHITAGVMLGKEREGFTGTDALGMSVNPDAIEWANSKHPYRFIIGEGARLANIAFLTALNKNTNLTVAYLVADNAAQRREQRSERLGTELQAESWVKGRKTGARNLAALCTQQNIEVITIDTSTREPSMIASEIYRHIRPVERGGQSD